jgi:nucleotide-binding universal stress UspA family protein
MKVLAAIDTSESSHKALEQALRFITHQETTFILLGVEAPIMLPPTSVVPGFLGDDPQIAFQEEAELSQIEQEHTAAALRWAENLCQQAGVSCTSCSEYGDPKHVICDVARQEQCDLIVVGSHGYGVFERMLMGSVSDYVVHHAHCAVMVVRDGAS